MDRAKELLRQPERVAVQVDGLVPPNRSKCVGRASDGRKHGAGCQGIGRHRAAVVLLGALLDLAELREAHADVQALGTEGLRKDEHVLLDHAGCLLKHAQHPVDARQQVVRLPGTNNRSHDNGAISAAVGLAAPPRAARSVTWLMKSGTISCSLRTRSACGVPSASERAAVDIGLAA